MRGLPVSEYAPRSMSIEAARVMRVDPEGVWVEGIDRSACGSCALRSGCGQGLLSGLWTNPPLLKISRGPHDGVLTEGDIVRVAIPGAALVCGAMLLYLLPLLCFLGMALAGNLLFGTESATVLFAAGGLLLGGALVRLVSILQKNNESLRPSIVVPGEDTLPATAPAIFAPTTVALMTPVATKHPQSGRQRWVD